jgi:hypothetical protein
VVDGDWLTAIRSPRRRGVRGEWAIGQGCGDGLPLAFAPWCREYCVLFGRNYGGAQGERKMAKRVIKKRAGLKTKKRSDRAKKKLKVHLTFKSASWYHGAAQSIGISNSVHIDARTGRHWIARMAEGHK